MVNIYEQYIREAEKLFEEQRIDEAKRILEGLLEEEPGYAKAHNHLGWMYFYHENEEKKAEMHLNYSVLFEPSYAPAYLHLACLYIRKSEYKKAMEILEKGLEAKDANKVSIYEMIGQCYEAMEEYSTAIRHYKSALRFSLNEWEASSIESNIKRTRKKRLMFLW
jgi:tetratricopeptide (TPR) repeat protein